MRLTAHAIRVQGEAYEARLGVHAAVDNAALLLPCDVVFAVELREPPVVRLNNLLTSRKLELGAAQRLDRLQANAS